MTTFDTTRWYRTAIGYRKVRPLVSFTDSRGFVAAACESGIFTLVSAANLTLIPERHTVELRVPKVGERYIGYYGDIITVHGTTTIAAWVIVDDEFDPAAELEAYRTWRKNEETS